jgi:hypothetical protein
LPIGISPTVPRFHSVRGLPQLYGEKSLRYRVEYMCDRFTLRSRDRIKLNGLITSELPFEARYNIAPGQTILAVADFGHGPGADLISLGPYSLME